MVRTKLSPAVERVLGDILHALKNLDKKVETLMTKTDDVNAALAALTTQIGQTVADQQRLLAELATARANDDDAAADAAIAGLASATQALAGAHVTLTAADPAPAAAGNTTQSGNASAAGNVSTGNASASGAASGNASASSAAAGNASASGAASGDASGAADSDADDNADDAGN